MNRRARRTFEPAPEGVSAVRTFAAVTAARWGFDAIEEDARLVASELATNAVVHARTRFAVCLRKNARGLVVEVTDTNPALPTGLLGNPHAETSGRGLGLVAASAVAWGVRRTPEGKAVWAQLQPDPPAVTPTEEEAVSKDDSYADPQDLAFGNAAKEKEEALDEQGRPSPQDERLEQAEAREEPPRPAGKAEPAD